MFKTIAGYVREHIFRCDICVAVFKSDRDAGLILFAGMVLDCAARALLG